ncbi:MAG: hypothetical protein Q7J48_01540 [Nocardioides sp.]|nr:hypothetical protein [Nocardioides sp.]
MPDYECYGLLLRSELPLPELLESAPAAHAAPDVTIKRGDLAAGPGTDLDVLTADRLWRGPTAMRLCLDGVATYEVRDGVQIVVDEAPGADPGELRLYLLGTCLGSLLQQRGLLVLHGNSIRVGDSCAVVVGHSGAGKSTLAAEFVRRGYDLLADDVVPVDDGLRALPGFPKIKLWEDAAHRYGIDVSELERVRPQDAKYHVPVDRASLAPLPVRWVYVLGESDGDDLALKPARGVDRFGMLWRHSYRPRLLQGFATRAVHLERCNRLQAAVRLVQVDRPRETMTPAATASAILDDIAAHPPTTMWQHQEAR